MTAKDLSQIYYLGKEIKMWQDELNKLECQSLIKGQEITDMPFASGITDKVGDLATEIADTKAIINGKLAEIQIQRKKIIGYISNIEDSLMRQIMFYRHISCMEWNDVADYIAGEEIEDNNKKDTKKDDKKEITGDSLRMKHNRFLKKK